MFQLFLYTCICFFFFLSPHKMARSTKQLSHASFARSVQIENKWSSICAAQTRLKCLNEIHYLAYGVYENSIKGSLVLNRDICFINVCQVANPACFALASDGQTTSVFCGNTGLRGSDLESMLFIKCV